jgi:hypothetical protein
MDPKDMISQKYINKEHEYQVKKMQGLIQEKPSNIPALLIFCLLFLIPLGYFFWTYQEDKLKEETENNMRSARIWGLDGNKYKATNKKNK